MFVCTNTFFDSKLHTQVIIIVCRFGVQYNALLLPILITLSRARKCI